MEAIYSPEDARVRSTQRKLLLLSFFVFSFFHLALFCAYYLISVLKGSAALIYTVYFLADFVSYLLPTLAVAGMLTLSCLAARRTPYLYGALLALSRVFYEIPTRAYGFMAEGFDTLYALLFALLVSLGVTLLYFAVFLLLFLLARFLFLKRGGKADMLTSPLPRPLSYAFATEEPLPLAILSAVGLLFLGGLIRETADTVSFLIGVSFVSTTGEILYLVGRYLFLLASFLVLQVVGVFYALKTAERTDA